MTAMSRGRRDYHEQVGMGDALRRGFENYATFSGRANRGEFWFRTLATVLIAIGLSIVDTSILGFDVISSPFSNLWSLATLIPGFAITSRRLHDIDMSGWWQLIVIIPVVGWILMLVWLSHTPGTIM